MIPPPLLPLFCFLLHCVFCCVSPFSLLKSWPPETTYTMHSLSWPLFYPLYYDHPKLFVSLILKYIHKIHGIKFIRVKVSRNCTSVGLSFLKCSSYYLEFCLSGSAPFYSTVVVFAVKFIFLIIIFIIQIWKEGKWGGGLWRKEIDAGGVGKIVLGQHLTVLTFLTPSCPTHYPSVWHPIRSEH